MPTTSLSSRDRTDRSNGPPAGSIREDGMDHYAYHRHQLRAMEGVRVQAERIAALASSAAADGPWLDAGTGPGVLRKAVLRALPDPPAAEAIDADQAMIVVEVDPGQFRSRVFRAVHGLLRLARVRCPISEALHRSLDTGRTTAGWSELLASRGFTVRPGEPMRFLQTITAIKTPEESA